MSLFTKIFGSKATSDSNAAEPQEAEFVAVLLMHQRGEQEPALKGYQQIAAAFPDDAAAPFFAAAILAGKGEVVEAAQNLRSLSRRLSLVEDTIPRAVIGTLFALGGDQPLFRLPAVAEISANFGDLLKGAGFLQESAVCFEVAAGLIPDNAHVLHKLGDTLHDLRIYDYAEEVLQAAIECAPHHWGALYTYAVLLQDLGRNDEAIAYYERAVRLNPDHVNCQNNYGAALLRTNRLDEALVHCSRAAALDPKSPFVKVNLGNIYRLMHKYDKARTCFDEAISLDANLAIAYFGLGSVEQAQKGSSDRVRELYLKALEINPSIAEAHHALGILLAEDGNPEALAHFSVALQLNQDLKHLQKDCGKACLQLGRREEALAHLKTALEQDPDDEVLREVVAKVEAENQV